MRSRFDPLLLELFESVYQELSKALEKQQRLSEVCGRDQLVTHAEQMERIAKLEVTMTALEGALDRGETGPVH